jgi:hypothetical protein
MTNDLYIVADERGLQGWPAGEEGQAAAKHDTQLRVKAARIEGAPPFPFLFLLSSFSLL